MLVVSDPTSIKLVARRVQDSIGALRAFSDRRAMD
jgi:hypothetical protein